MTSPNFASGVLRWVIGPVSFLLAAVVLSPGCFGLHVIPNQAQFEDLSLLAERGEAVVRVYGAPVPRIELLAIHTWIVIKEADSTVFERWEVFQHSDAPYGYVHLNLLQPESDVGAGGTYVISELVGEDAVHVVEFVSEQSPEYPCMNTYIVFPGPNSNSFTQWVLDSTGWDVDLPLAAIGKDTRARCQ